MRYQGWVVVIADDDAGDAFCPSVDMKGVCYGLLSDWSLGKAWGGGGGTFLFYILSLAGLRPLGNGLAEE